MTTTQKVAATVTALFGAIAYITTIPQAIDVGESLIVNETATESYVVTKESDTEKTVTVTTARYDKDTGDELEPVVVRYSLSQLESDRDGKLADVARMQAEADAKDALVPAGTPDDEEITITKERYDEKTGEKLADEVTKKKASEILAEVESLQETADIVQGQADFLQNLITEADKVK